MSLIYLAEGLSRGNKIISEWYYFWPHFAYVFKVSWWTVQIPFNMSKDTAGDATVTMHNFPKAPR